MTQEEFWIWVVRRTVRALRNARTVRRKALRKAERAEIEQLRAEFRKKARMSRRDPYSQTQIAKAAGVHPMTYQKFARGEHVRADAARRINGALNALGVVDVASLPDREFEGHLAALSEA